MTIRITQSMLYARALGDVRNGTRGLTQLQQQLASGRRVNAPSDDPAAALRILPLRSELNDLSLLKDNVALARETLNTGAAALEEASTVMQRVRELVIQAANDTTSPSDRVSIGAEMGQLLDQMLGLANSKRGNRFLFGGARTDEAPFRLVTDAAGTRPVYEGDDRSVTIEVAPGITTDLNLPGNEIFLSRDRGVTTFTGNTGATPAGFGDSGVGNDTLTITATGLASAPTGMTFGGGTTTAVGNLAYTYDGTATPPTLAVGGGTPVSIPSFPVTDQAFTTSDGRTVNLSLASAPSPASGSITVEAGLSIDGGTTVQQIDFSANTVQVRNSLDGSVLNVDVSALARTGDERVTYAGTFDVLTVLIELRDVLGQAESLSNEEVSTRLTELLAEVDGAHEDVLDGLRALGSRSSNMELLTNRVDGLILSSRETLSRVEDTDLAESILQFNQKELTYQASLQVGARVVQTSLLNFLR